MTLRELIARVDRSSGNEASCNYEELCSCLDIVDGCGWRSEFDEAVTGFWLKKTHDTDSHVGMAVFFYRNKPVFVTQKPWRKSSTSFYFVSQQAANDVRAFIMTLLEAERPQVEIVDLELELGESFTVKFESEILVRNGSYLGRPCEAMRRPFGEQKPACTSVLVRFDDGDELEIPVEDFAMPYSTGKDNNDNQ